MTTASLETLMQQAQAGDKIAYQDLLNKSTQMIRPFLLQKVSRPQDAEDILQEILLAIHKARHTYHPSRPYKPWLFALAHYKLNDYLRAYYRKQQREIGSDHAILEQIAGTDETFEAETKNILQKALASLNTKQATIMRRTKLEGYSIKEVANEMNMSESAVKVSIHRSLKQLRHYFEKQA